jgi:hypothetical protein
LLRVPPGVRYALSIGQLLFQNQRPHTKIALAVDLFKPFVCSYSSSLAL